MFPKNSSTPSEIYQVKVTLKGSKPPIWRRFLVADNITLRMMHDILQVVMGWEDYHLHMFTVYGGCYGDPADDETGDLGIKDERQVQLNQFVSGPGIKFEYEYDFGDSWEHTLLVEKVLPVEEYGHYPVCLRGKRACPPEDVGGVWGYTDFLEAINDPEHPEHDDYLEWIGDEFDPEYFDLEEINARLRQLG